MTFSEALQAMLDGKKVKRSNTTGYGYIMLDDEGNVVGNTGSPFSLSKKDFVADWEIASIPSAGTLLMRYGKPYRLIEETEGTYAFLDEETYVERGKGIDEEHLLSELEYWDFSIASDSDKEDLKDGDRFEDEDSQMLKVWKLSNGKYMLLSGLLDGYTKQELWEQVRKYHLNKVTDNDGKD